MARMSVEMIVQMPRCRDCRWWTIEDGSPWAWPSPVGLGACVLAESHGNEPVRPGTLAYAADGEDYRAILYTTPDFGCVQFEARA